MARFPGGLAADAVAEADLAGEDLAVLAAGLLAEAEPAGDGRYYANLRMNANLQIANINFSIDLDRLKQINK